MDKIANFSDVQSLSIELTKFSSVTDTPGEKAFPAFLSSILEQIPYFKQNPDDLVLMPIENDPSGRSNVFGLVRGKGKACVVLTGHYDVVETSMYGSMEPWAFEPKMLTEKILESLSAETRKGTPAMKLKNDLESGNFLPGRGILDMKSGLAAGISVLANHSALYERDGNLLFMVVSDEEGSSRGMKSASRALDVFLSERGMKAEAIINLDASVDQEEGDLGRAVFIGSVSKLLPFAFFSGAQTHAGAPFDGINSTMLASEFAREIECNPDVLGEKAVVPGEEPPPPTMLYFRETRSGYDVTTPSAVFCAVNILTYSKSPDEILSALRNIATQSMDKAISTLRERASTMSRRTGGHFSPPVAVPKTILFSDIVAEANRVSPGILAKIREYAKKSFPDDQVLQTQIIVKELATFARLEGPSAILGFAPPFYPRSSVDSERHQAFLSMLKRRISEFGSTTGTSVRIRPYFPGISDMSFLSPSCATEQFEFVASECPVRMDDKDGAHLKPVDCPVLNIGPWGRDYHQSGERVHKKYAFIELPELLKTVVKAILTTEKIV
jgi:arginine utilization protein RocB